MFCYNESMNMKNYIRIMGLPRVFFAHSYGAESYHNVLDRPSDAPTLLEVTYISKGALHFTLADGSTVTARERSVICNPYTRPLYVHAEARHEHQTVCCHLPFHREEAPPGTAGVLPFGVLCLPFIIPPLAENHPVFSLIDEIILAHTMHTKGEISCAGLMLQLLDRIDCHTRAECDTPVYSNHRHVKRAKEYIFAHLREPIRQTDIAAHLGLSSEYLCTIFKKTEGVPVMHFINRIKLEQIRQLMETNGLTLAEASELYGYTDPNYASRLYKKYFGHNITEALRK